MLPRICFSVVFAFRQSLSRGNRPGPLFGLSHIADNPHFVSNELTLIQNNYKIEKGFITSLTRMDTLVFLWEWRDFYLVMRRTQQSRKGEKELEAIYKCLDNAHLLLGVAFC